MVINHVSKSWDDPPSKGRNKLKSWAKKQAEVIQGVAIPTVLFFILRRLNKKSPGTPFKARMFHGKSTYPPTPPNVYIRPY